MTATSRPSGIKPGRAKSSRLCPTNHRAQSSTTTNRPDDETKVAASCAPSFKDGAIDCSATRVIASTTFKITIPAVKINGAVSTSSIGVSDPQAQLQLSSQLSVLNQPEPCLSSSSSPAVQTDIKLEPLDTSLFQPKVEPLPSLLADVESEDDFGEFLLDAVQWL